MDFGSSLNLLRAHLYVGVAHHHKRALRGGIPCRPLASGRWQVSLAGNPADGCHFAIFIKKRGDAKCQFIIAQLKSSLALADGLQ